MKRVLVTGAAGYLGQSTGRYFQQHGYTVFGIDNYSTSSRKFESPFPVIEQDLTDFEKTYQEIEKLLPLDGVIHFAAKAIVAESFLKPFDFFTTNIGATLNLVEICQRLRVNNILHSSTCAVYGTPPAIPIQEDFPLRPISPYGESKKAAEGVLKQYTERGSLKTICLRYFNPAGTLKNSDFGECHEPETHLIPRLIESAFYRRTVEIYGKDYPTTDGTCIRDYIHVDDLCLAHLKAFEYLKNQPARAFLTLNVGTGFGTSVLQVARAVESTLKIPLQLEFMAARPGDPACLVADVRKFKALFGWLPSRLLPEMVEDQWRFFQSRHK